MCVVNLRGLSKPDVVQNHRRSSLNFLPVGLVPVAETRVATFVSCSTEQNVMLLPSFAQFTLQACGTVQNTFKQIFPRSYQGSGAA